MNDTIIAFIIIGFAFVGGALIWIVMLAMDMNPATMNAIAIMMLSFISGLMVWAAIRGLFSRSGTAAEAGRKQALAEIMAEQEARNVREKFSSKNFGTDPGNGE
jgi:hypothetical protein